LTNPYFVFDRDGTLIEHIPYLSNLSEVKYKEGVFETLARLKDLGFRFGIVTNQSVIGRKKATRQTVNDINSEIINTIWAFSQAKFDFVQVCPHMPSDQCECRKPKPKLMIEAIQQFQIDCAVSYMVGDTESDVELGKKVGFRTVLIRKDTMQVETHADYIISKFNDILKLV
jgi:histidinol-phosphate phosphatase family protein